MAGSRALRDGEGCFLAPKCDQDRGKLLKRNWFSLPPNWARLKLFT